MTPCNTLSLYLARLRVHALLEMQAWSTRDSAELYNIRGWSNGYFDINDDGNVALSPFGPNGAPIDLKKVVDDLIRRGLSMPLLLRFSDILKRRVEELYGAFNGKIEEYKYQGRYQAVMPIKVNQQRHVVEELIQYGRPHNLGLEAGSKPELLVALALMDQQDGIIVCNGYKDAEYIETALLAQRLGRKPLIIVDRFQELEMVIQASHRLGLKPHIGVRAKLSTKGSGRWAESGGDRSKFGLTAAELVQTVEALDQAKMLDRLVCLHFHVGSQITAIRAVKDALREAVRIFVDLYRMGAPLSYIDVGGGLAVDYDGSKTNFHASKNYSMEEYAADIVDGIGSTLNEEKIPHPTIISESGRALVAHHAVLVFNVLGHDEVTVGRPTEATKELEEHQVIRDLREVLTTVTRKNYQEAYHDALQLKEDALSLYRHGIINLRGRARVEELFWAISKKIMRLVRELDYIPDDFEALDKQLSDTYFCNFSVFQSVPDSWAVDHLFPVMPIHRLREQPTRHGILADLTCDSDGKMDRFIDLHDVKNTLELHPFVPDQPYFLGVFLVGAYQEILGDLHNLFGDVNAVHIVSGPDGYRVKHVVEGDRVKDVLQYVSYDQRSLMTALRESIEEALSKGTMTFEESAALVRHFEAGLEGYTYLEDPEMPLALLRPSTKQASAQAAGGETNLLSVVPEAG
jgi:arginine decarboxylase